MDAMNLHEDRAEGELEAEVEDPGAKHAVAGVRADEEDVTEAADGEAQAEDEAEGGLGGLDEDRLHVRRDPQEPQERDQRADDRQERDDSTNAAVAGDVVAIDFDGVGERVLGQTSGVSSIKEKVIERFMVAPSQSGLVS